MRDFTGTDGGNGAALRKGSSAGGALRHELLNHITPLLVECNEMGDSNRRLLIQACCLDLVTGLEELIQAYELDDLMPPR